MILPAPADLGLPERFVRWRADQDQAVLNGVGSDARFVVQAMPTGSGKSLVYMAHAVR